MISPFRIKQQFSEKIKGFIPLQLQTSERDYETEQTRFILRQAWNTKYKQQVKSQPNSKPAIGPFRAINNAGDLLSRENYSCGGSNQVSQSRPGLHGLKNIMGSIHSSCDGTRVPSATCNPKYVYDSSDYIRFRKQSAVSNNYNDNTYGGDQSNASQVAIKAARRY